MQTVINADMAVGVPGEFATTRPRYSYAVEASAAVTFGKAVTITSGKVAPATNAASFKGICGTPHQHVQNALPSETATLTVPAGTVVDVIERGEVFIALPTSVTATAGVGLTVKSGEFAALAEGDVAVVTALKNGVGGDIIPVRLGF